MKWHGKVSSHLKNHCLHHFVLLFIFIRNLLIIVPNINMYVCDYFLYFILPIQIDEIFFFSKYYNTSDETILFLNFNNKLDTIEKIIIVQ